jgi:phenylpyruvate tautomerase PptA (4-oxalocrotonate tautomerase family)
MGSTSEPGRRVLNMPLVKIEILNDRSASEKTALFDAIHEALVEALNIPDNDRVQRLIEHERDDFDVPSPSFTIVTITMFPGRSVSAKRELFQRIVEKLGQLGIPANDVNIVLEEPPLENWGIRGGRPASEVELGFELDV